MRIELRGGRPPGLGATLTWLDGADHNAGALALDLPLPLADEGLRHPAWRRRIESATSA